MDAEGPEDKSQPQTRPQAGAGAYAEEESGAVTAVPYKVGRARWVTAGVVGLLSAFMMLAFIRLEGVFAWHVLLAPVLVGGSVIVLAHIRRACRVTVTRQEVVHRTFWGRIRRIPGPDIGLVLYAPDVDLGKTGGPEQRADYLVLLDARGRPLLKLNSLNIWPVDELGRLAQAMGGADVVYQPETPAARIRDDHRGAMPYHIAYPPHRRGDGARGLRRRLRPLRRRLRELVVTASRLGAGPPLPA